MIIFFHRLTVFGIVKHDVGTMPSRIRSPDHQVSFKQLCHRIMVQNNQKSRGKYWATRSSVRSFARTAHSFACSGLLASLAPSAALTRSLTSLTPSLVDK